MLFGSPDEILHPQGENCAPLFWQLPSQSQPGWLPHSPGHTGLKCSQSSQNCSSVVPTGSPKGFKQLSFPQESPAGTGLQGQPPPHGVEPALFSHSGAQGQALAEEKTSGEGLSPPSLRGCAVVRKHLRMSARHKILFENSENLLRSEQSVPRGKATTSSWRCRLVLWACIRADEGGKGREILYQLPDMCRWRLQPPPPFPQHLFSVLNCVQSSMVINQIFPKLVFLPNQCVDWGWGPETE